MAILPLAAAITVLLDGKQVLSYASAYVAAGRTYAPLSPYVTRVADRLLYAGDALVLERGTRRVRLLRAAVTPDALDREYVAIAPVLRALGATVEYDGRRRTVEISLPAPEPVASPQPFDPNAPLVAPRVVFTPSPSPQPRIVWHGPAVPRRTPLPYPEPP